MMLQRRASRWKKTALLLSSQKVLKEINATALTQTLEIHSQIAPLDFSVRLDSARQSNLARRNLLSSLGALRPSPALLTIQLLSALQVRNSATTTPLCTAELHPMLNVSLCKIQTHDDSTRTNSILTSVDVYLRMTSFSPMTTAQWKTYLGHYQTLLMITCA